MKKLLIKIIVFIFSLGILNITTVHGEFINKKIRIEPTLYLIGSIYADETNTGYINGELPGIFLEGISYLELKEVSTHLVSIDNGYRLDYQGYLTGTTHPYLQKKYEKAGFDIRKNNEFINIRKQISGSFYFIKWSENECTLTGTCKF